MKLSCSDFTGGWSSAPAQTIALPDRLQPEPSAPLPAWEDEPRRTLAPLDFDDVGDTVPSAEALADVLGPLFDRTDEVPALPFFLDTPLEMQGLVALSS